MKTLKITGDFENSVNNSVILRVYSLEEEKSDYSFAEKYEADFEKTITVLSADCLYYVSFVGYTTGTFNLLIGGEIIAPNPIKGSYSNGAFSPGHTIKTNK